MQPAAEDVGFEPLHKLMETLTACDPGTVREQVVAAAAKVCSAEYAGLVEVDPVRKEAWPVHQYASGGPWPITGDVLELLGDASDTLHLRVGHLSLMGVPIPLNTRHQAVLWVAGSDFTPHDEDLLIRLATAAGRALEAVCDLDAAARLLRNVHAFSRTAAHGSAAPYLRVRTPMSTEGR